MLAEAATINLASVKWCSRLLAKCLAAILLLIPFSFPLPRLCPSTPSAPGNFSGLTGRVRQTEEQLKRVVDNKFQTTINYCYKYFAKAFASNSGRSSLFSCLLSGSQWQTVGGECQGDFFRVPKQSKNWISNRNRFQMGRGLDMGMVSENLPFGGLGCKILLWPRQINHPSRTMMKLLFMQSAGSGHLSSHLASWRQFYLCVSCAPVKVKKFQILYRWKEFLRYFIIFSRKNPSRIQWKQFKQTLIFDLYKRHLFTRLIISES